MEIASTVGNGGACFLGCPGRLLQSQTLLGMEVCGSNPHASHNPVTKASAPEEIALFGGAKSGLQAIVPPEVAAPGKEHVWRQRHHHMFWDCDVVKAGHLGPICPHVAKKVAPGPQSSNKMQ